MPWQTEDADMIRFRNHVILKLEIYTYNKLLLSFFSRHILEFLGVFFKQVWYFKLFFEMPEVITSNILDWMAFSQFVFENSKCHFLKDFYFNVKIAPDSLPQHVSGNLQ